MFIEENEFNLQPYGGFELETNKISNTTIRKSRIVLPYTGKLPAELTGGKATITIGIGIDLSIVIFLQVRKNGTTNKFVVQADVEEINKLLERFFFKFVGNTGYARFDCGLNKYWLGHFQSSFLHWQRLVRDAYGICEVVDQLTTENKDRLIRHLMSEQVV